MAEKETRKVYYNDGEKDHSYKEKANDFKEYYSDNENDFSFRENLIKSVFLIELQKTDLNSAQEVNSIAERSIVVADVLLEKMYNKKGVE
jgi:hypothetical protein